MSHFMKRLMKLIKTPQPQGFEKPFVIFLTVVLVVASGVNIFQILTNGQSVLAFGVVVLAGVSIWLHWVAPRFYTSADSLMIWFYLAVQTLLAFVLTILSPQMLFAVMGLSFFLSLLGEAYGGLHNKRTRYGVTAGLLVVSLAAWLMNGSLISIWDWVLGMLPATAFIIIYVTLFLEQSEAKEKAQSLLHELRHANRELEESAREISTLTLMTERQRMARELHDTLAQGLAGIILQMEAADSYLEKGQHTKAQTIIQQAMQRARQVLGESRQVIDDLRKKAYDPEGFASWIRDAAASFTGDTGIPCSTALAPLPENLPLDLQLALQRIVSEGLVNIKKHARASHAWISLQVREGCLMLEINDDGCGFELSQVHSQPDRYGLIGVEERVIHLGGRFDINTSPGDGTTLDVVLPLSADQKVTC